MSAKKKVLHESDILIPRDPSITNTDEWPEFRIVNATVTSSASNELVSLLTAGEHNPLTLTGTIEASSRGQTHLWRSSKNIKSDKTISLRITEILNYSYGAYADGSIDLWAAGKAGWFLIRPSKQYRATYNEMIDAVRILFFIVDAYSTPRKSGKGKNATILPDYTAQELFEKYAIEVMGVEKGAPEAAKKMYKHKEFLLSIMIEGREGIAWSKNPIYAHLCRKFSDIAKGIRQRIADSVARAKEAEKVQAQVQREVAQHKRQTSIDSVSTTSSLKRKRGRPPKDSSVISITSTSVDGSTIEQSDAQPEKKQALKSTRSTRSNPTPSTPEIEDSNVTTPAQQGSDSEASNPRRKSALRLKPNKPTKGPPKKVAPRLSQLDAGNGEEEESEDELASAGVAPTSKRKKGNSSSSVGAWGRTIAKPWTSIRSVPNARTEPPDRTETVDEGIDIPSSPESDAIAGAEGTEELALRLLHKPDQLQKDTWVCALDGCSHKVYGPQTSPDTQRLIREHYALHAYDDDDRVRLVKAVAEPSLPINHLIERVRGQVRQEGISGVKATLKSVGTRFPEPLVTKF